MCSKDNGHLVFNVSEHDGLLSVNSFFFQGLKLAFPVLKPTFSESRRSGEKRGGGGDYSYSLSFKSVHVCLHDGARHSPLFISSFTASKQNLPTFPNPNTRFPHCHHVDLP